MSFGRAWECCVAIFERSRASLLLAIRGRTDGSMVIFIGTDDESD
jgi:hypothetical protein